MKKSSFYTILIILIILSARWVPKIVQEVIDYLETPSSNFKITDEDLNTINNSVRGSKILHQFKNQQNDDKEDLEKDGLLLNPTETNLDNVIINKEINFK